MIIKIYKTSEAYQVPKIILLIFNDILMFLFQIAAAEDHHVGYSSPLEAYNQGRREKLAYVTCISAKWETTGKHDFVATIDLDPQSSTYSKVNKLLCMIIGVCFYDILTKLSIFENYKFLFDKNLQFCILYEKVVQI